MNESTLRAQSGIRLLQVAINRAQALANVYDEPYSVFHYTDTDEYDVQPESPFDASTGRVYRAEPVSVE